jgi:hypothetical protein
MQSILSSGSSVKISKLQAGSGFHKAIVIGDGLKFAERQIKQHSSKPAQAAVDYTLNMNGLECRWDKVKPPVQDNEIVCYLIEARDKQKQVEVFRNVLLRIDDIYGSVEYRSPLSPARLKLLSSLHKAQSEMLVKYGGWNVPYLLRTFFTTLLGKFYFKNNLNIGNIRAQDYLLQLIANADTLTIDGRINTIISGKKSKRLELLEYLRDQEQKGVLVFGHHISKESVMTCYIENMNSDHIHFVDGADGGYTEAARELKRKALVSGAR